MTSNTQDIEVDQNYDAFQRQLSTILPKHRNEYALMHAKQVVAFYHSPGDAYRAGLAQFGKQPFSIQEVTDEPIDLGFYSHVAL